MQSRVTFKIVHTNKEMCTVRLVMESQSLRSPHSSVECDNWVLKQADFARRRIFFLQAYRTPAGGVVWQRGWWGIAWQSRRTAAK